MRTHLLAVALAVLASAVVTGSSNPVQVMVVTGGHPYDTSFGSLFEGYPEISAQVWPRDVALRGDLRKKWDVLVMYDLTQEITDAEQKRLREYLESGKGLVVLHHALGDYDAWNWWHEEVVGGTYYVKAQEGHPQSTYHAGMDVTYAAEPHPVTEGVGKLHFVDETYKSMWFSPKVKPLLRSDHEQSDPVVAWIGPYEKARVVAIQPGHDRKTHEDAAYRKLVKNAILWAAGRKG